jgi:ABC-type nitrate/sulfonate/bicarbonate transport system substrate-binding protein
VKRAVLLLFALAAAAGSLLAWREGYVERVQNRIWGRPPRLSAGDFPAGVSAPVADVASVPLRPTLVGVVARGSNAGLLWAASPGGPLKTSYALDVRAVPFEREELLRRALLKGGDNGGVDLAAMSVSQLALQASLLRDASPRTVLLLGRSRGQDALAATAEIPNAAALKGKRIGVEPASTGYYFLLWVMSRAGLTLREVTVVELDRASEAGKALSTGKVDAAAGYAGDLDPVVKVLGGNFLSSTVDAPHLIATVLVARGDFAARYPDAIRRILRGTLDANATVAKDSSAAARVLGDVAPWLGDPAEAIHAAPPASVRDNLAFFGLAGEAPVTYFELYQSAGALGTRLWNNSPVPAAEDTCDLGALKYVSSTHGP